MANEYLHRHAQARPAAVSALPRDLVSYAERVGASATTCEAVRLAVSEALTNVVVHAYGNRESRPMRVEARIDADERLCVTISDHGPGMAPQPDRPGPGLGLALIARMADESLSPVETRAAARSSYFVFRCIVLAQAARINRAHRHDWLGHGGAA